MSAILDFDSLNYTRKLEQAGFTREQAEIQAEMQRAAIQELLARHDEAVRRDLATRSDVQDVRLEIEKVRAEVEKSRAEVEKVRAEVEKVRAEVEKVRAETKVEIEKVRAELKTDIAETRAEIEKVRAELKADIAGIRADVEKTKYALLKWQIGIGLALVAIMAKGFGWIGFIH